MIVDALAVLLIVLIPFNWFVAIVLMYTSHQYPQILSLKERSYAAVICAIVATIAGALAWARLGVLDISGSAALAMIALGLILVSVPQLYWLWLLVTGRWKVGGRR